MNELVASDLLKEAEHPLFSVEFFPPKTRLGFGMLGGTIEHMRPIHPDFVSVTYGAGGSTQELTLDACTLLQRMGFGPVVVHLTCVGASRDQLTETIQLLYEKGFRNIMCLRGDPPKGKTTFVPQVNGLQYAAELVTLVKELHPDICCGVAGYPEKHPEAESLEKDVINLQHKVDAGASFITTQMFYDNDIFYRFVDLCRSTSIDVPIIPGLMPVTSKAQIERIVELSGAAMPATLIEAIEAEKENATAVEAIGMEWTISQIEGLLQNGTPGIHLYILNRAATITSPILARSLALWRR